ncbi:MAG: hypothetical protein M5U14_03995 [Acidimicrobiia bacterium]|nr:hypothetical protein [Acidimicrobiia bacterium]
MSAPALHPSIDPRHCTRCDVEWSGAISDTCFSCRAGGERGHLLGPVETVLGAPGGFPAGPLMRPASPRARGRA